MSNKIKDCIDGFNYIATQDATDNLEDVKSNRNMSMNELAYSEINAMYFNAIAGDNKELGANVSFVPYTGSDASREHIINFDLNALYNKLLATYGKELNITNIKNKGYRKPNFTLEERTKVIEKAYYENEKAYYTNVKNKLLSDYRNALSRNPIKDLQFNDLNAINEFIKNKKENEIVKFLYNPDPTNKVDAIRGFHYFPSRANNGIRKELLDKIAEFERPDASPEKYIRDNLGNKDNIFQKDKNNKTSIFEKDAILIEKVKLTSSVEDILSLLNDKDNIGRSVIKDNKLNPLVYNFLLERLLVTGSFNRRVLGDIMQFKGDNLGKSFVESVKRNKQGVSTFYTYYTDLSKQPDGIGTKSKIAVVKDPKEKFKNLISPEEDIDYPDGASFSLHLAQYKKGNSLGGDIGFNAGIHHKSVGTNYGLVSTFQKHNDFTITNESIRNSYGTKYNWDSYVKKMLSSVNFAPRTINGLSYAFYDVDNDRIVEGVLNNFTYTNMYQLWEKVGGAYSVVKSNKNQIKGTKYRYTTIEDIEDSSRKLHDIETQDFISIYKNLLIEKVNSELPKFGSNSFQFSYDAQNDSVKLDTGEGMLDVDLLKLTTSAETKAENDRNKELYKAYRELLDLISKKKIESIKQAELNSIKGQYVESISFVSAIKTGQTNVNDIYNNEIGDVDFGEQSLRFMEFDNRTRGIQLTSEKDVEEAEATLPQQLIGATSFGGFTPELAQRAYDDIKKLAIESIDQDLLDLIKIEGTSDRSELMLKDHGRLMDYIRKFMKKSIEGKDSSELVSEILSEVGNTTFDVKSLNRIFVSSFNSYLTKEGIKKSLPGTQFVLKPPHEIFEVTFEEEVLKDNNVVKVPKTLIMQGEEFRRFKAKNKNFTAIRRHLKKAKFLINKKSIEDITLKELYELVIGNKIELSDIEKNTLNTFFKNNSGDVITSLINRSSKDPIIKEQLDRERLQLENMLQDFLNKFAIDKYKNQWQAEPGEVLAPSIWKREFYIDSSTEVNDINVEYFKERIKTNADAFVDFALLSGAELNADVMNLLDIMRPVTFRFSALDKLKIQESFLSRKIELNDADITTEKGQENLILANELKRVKKDIKEFNKNKKENSDFINNYQSKEVLDPSLIDSLMTKFAQDKVEDFEKGHTFITQRIPLQSLASVMVNKTVGFIHTEMNTIMVNNDHQKSTGGDFDVDKSTAIVMDIRRLLSDKQKKQQRTINSLFENFRGIANDGRNLLVRERVVTTAKLSDISLSYEQGKIEAMSHESFNDRIDSKYNNMLGKDEIGIFAVALKTLSGITSSFYKSFAIINQLDEKIKKETLQTKRNVLIKKKEELIQYLSITPITLGDKTYSIPANLNLNEFSPENIEIIVTKLYEGTGTLEERVFKVREELSLQDKAYDILGQFLNLATDNAKELKLNGLNSTMQTAGIYAHGIIMGVKVEEIAAILNDKNVKNIISKAERSIYEKSFNKGVKKQLDEITNKTGNLLKFNTLFKKQEQFKIIGKVFGINQGLKSDSFAIYNFKQMIRTIFRNSVLDKEKKFTPDEKNEILEEGSNFDLVRFIDSLATHDKFIYDPINEIEPYSTKMIRLFDKVKSSFNILNLVATNNHYRGQFEVFAVAEKVYKQTSIRLRETENLIEHFINNNYFDRDYLDEKTFNRFSNMFDMILADQYLKTSFKQNPPFIINNVRRGKLVSLDFSKNEDRNEFIDLAHEMFKFVKDKPRYKDNEFLNNLIQDSETDVFGNKHVYYKMLDNQTDSSSTRQMLKQASYKASLEDLMNENIVMEINGVKFINNLLDVLRMYNLLVHKDSMNQKAFTKYFPVNTYNRSKDMSLSYADFLSHNTTKKLDFNTLLNPKDISSFVSLMLNNRIYSVSFDKEFKSKNFTFVKAGDGWTISSKGKQYTQEELLQLTSSLYNLGTGLELDVKKEPIKIDSREINYSLLADC